jgi:hypothetical protein
MPSFKFISTMIIEAEDKETAKDIFFDACAEKDFAAQAKCEEISDDIMDQ